MTSKYIKQKLEVSQGNTDKPTVTMEDFNRGYRIFEQISQPDLIDIQYVEQDTQLQNMHFF